jgi:hypothetical protein
MPVSFQDEMGLGSVEEILLSLSLTAEKITSRH